MKVLTSSSPTEPLAWAEIPERKLRADEVVVAVRAAGVNPVDWKMRQGDLLGVAQRIVGPSGPLVCGIDFAGEVTAVGAAVTDLKLGDRVVGGTDFSRQQFGSYASQVHVRADQVAVLPPQVAFDEAACLPVAGVTAQTCLFDIGKLDQRQEPRALVLGAAGGVGHFAVQLAKLRGAVSVGVCSERNVALVERLGGIAIDYTKGDVAAAAAQHGPYDVIVDAVGSATYPIAMCLKLLKKGGVHVLVMPNPRDYWRLVLPGPVKTVLGRPGRASLEPLVAELAAGRLQVVIAERIPMAEAERAHQLSRAGKVVGKLVLVA
jgi:NADPH:quinone reductase-like Zn-dependent oxidoreductase